jgi:hypothetical protein
VAIPGKLTIVRRRRQTSAGDGVGSSRSTS